jgi:hypothetical protein
MIELVQMIYKRGTSEHLSTHPRTGQKHEGEEHTRNAEAFVSCDLLSAHKTTIIFFNGL